MKSPGPVYLIVLYIVSLTLLLCTFYGYTCLSICPLLNHQDDGDLNSFSNESYASISLGLFSRYLLLIF